MSDPFSPAGVEFTPVSKSLASVRLLAALVPLGLAAASILLLGVLVDSTYFLGLVPVLAIIVWLLWLIPRQVRNLQFAAAETDLYVRRGIMFRRLDQVPYGRVQYVEVKEGPVARYFGIATLQVFTASAQTDAAIPGMDKADAAALRALLVERGPSSSAGI